ncbi:hypothetical protein N7495_007663 [Penicillium taxi]|uniref:uncharacterized protein n=1 Tax=Penicillium taxi TaxID=168475 RepID=UPI002545583C|nr:uncharacterized protein N7495_007663 [Penicillium taxi]KAJ5887622.1 hypothetical protein N7495_007663 [Penicillium taxi]
MCPLRAAASGVLCYHVIYARLPNMESYFSDDINTDELGLNDDDDNSLPPIDQTLRERFTAVEDVTPIGEPKILIPLSNKPTGGLSVLEFEHVAELPDYPRSHLQGYAYMIDLKGIAEDDVSNRLKAHQYGHYRHGGSHNIYSPVLGCDVKKRYMRCSGVKKCIREYEQQLEEYETLSKRRRKAADRPSSQSGSDSERELKGLREIKFKDIDNFTLDFSLQ